MVKKDTGYCATARARREREREGRGGEREREGMLTFNNRTVTETHYRGSDGILVVFDLTNRGSFFFFFL